MNDSYYCIGSNSILKINTSNYETSIFNQNTITDVFMTNDFIFIISNGTLDKYDHQMKLIESIKNNNNSNIDIQNNFIYLYNKTTIYEHNFKDLNVFFI